MSVSDSVTMGARGTVGPRDCCRTMATDALDLRCGPLHVGQQMRGLTDYWLRDGCEWMGLGPCVASEGWGVSAKVLIW